MAAKLKVVSKYVDAVETLATWKPDVEPMLVEHWRELATYPEIPLDPDWGWYSRAENLGNLKIYTTRFDQRLIAYALFVWTKAHPHYRSIGWASNDIIWVAPDARKRGVATALFDFLESDLKRLFSEHSKSGTGIIACRSKTKHPELARLLSARGYRSDEHGHTKRV